MSVPQAAPLTRPHRARSSIARKHCMLKSISFTPCALVEVWEHPSAVIITCCRLGPQPEALKQGLDATRNDGRRGPGVAAAQEHQYGHPVLRRSSPHKAVTLHHARLAHADAAQRVTYAPAARGTAAPSAAAQGTSAVRHGAMSATWEVEIRKNKRKGRQAGNLRAHDNRAV